MPAAPFPGIDLQPTAANALVRVEPLQPGDFEALYAVAADPLIWEQHPSNTRYQRPVFETYFEGALLSGGALRVFDQLTDQLIGSSRYYDWDAGGRQLSIGYTFLARATWARGYNRALKTLMLDHAFGFANRVTFSVGANNRRSRTAMEKLGGRLIGEAAVSYHGEPSHPNVIYQIEKAAWVDSPMRFRGLRGP